MKSRRILLLGANGRTGRQILDRALAAGDTVTALVRAEDRLADLDHERLRVQVGSPCDPAVLEPLLVGQDAVVSVLGPRWPTRDATAIYPDAATAIVEAMQRSRVRRLVVTSSALLFPARDVLARVLQCLVRGVVADAHRMESRIRASTLDWTIVRTSFLTNGPSTDCAFSVDALPEAARPCHARPSRDSCSTPAGRTVTRNEWWACAVRPTRFGVPGPR
ncbi:MAG: SDR family oxidoreductase [Deltaproteobacteria bacterium]